MSDHGFFDHASFFYHVSIGFASQQPKRPALAAYVTLSWHRSLMTDNAGHARPRLCFRASRFQLIPYAL